MGCRCKEKKRTTWNQRQAERAAAGHAEELDTQALTASGAPAEQGQTDNS